MADHIIANTDFHFPGQEAVYHGKVRDVYDLGDTLLMVATDRYSAFDRNLALVPHKGELLTAISQWWFEQTRSIVNNHIISYPDPNIAWCRKYKVIPIEMIVRGYITGVTNTSLWHTYSNGQREYGDFTLPDGLTKNQKLPHPVLTPTTKFGVHDRPLTPQEAVAEGLVDEDVWKQLQRIALDLFTFGQQQAEAKGLILVDTKYEFGVSETGEIVLIDEVHTPDSSRYWRVEDYEAVMASDADDRAEPDNYDKEFLRLWYKARFDPYDASGAEPPAPPQEVIDALEQRYVYVYEQLTGATFAPSTEEPLSRMEAHVQEALAAA